MGTSTGSQVPQESVEEVQQLKLSTRLNMGACYRKTGQHAKCVDVCGKALEISESSKAYFRRAQANLELRALDEAKRDFEKAREMEPNDLAIVQELKRLKAAFQQHEAKEKKKFAKMFNKMAEEPEAPAIASEATTEIAAAEPAEAAAASTTAART